MKETYISFDVETTGPCPGLYSMIEMGFKVIGAPEGQGQFHCALKELPGAYWQDGTKEFWAKHLGTLKTIQDKAYSPEVALANFRMWLSSLKNPVLVGMPASWDFQFILYYWYRFNASMLVATANDPPFGLKALDGHTMMALALRPYKIPFSEVRQRTFKEYFEEWFVGMKHTHRALEDAIEQAVILEKLMKYLGLWHE